MHYNSETLQVKRVFFNRLKKIIRQNKIWILRCTWRGRESGQVKSWKNFDGLHMSGTFSGDVIAVTCWTSTFLTVSLLDARIFPFLGFVNLSKLKNLLRIILNFWKVWVFEDLKFFFVVYQPQDKYLGAGRGEKNQFQWKISNFRQKFGLYL